MGVIPMKLCDECGYVVLSVHTPGQGDVDWDFVGYFCMNCKKYFTEEEYEELKTFPYPDMPFVY